MSKRRFEVYTQPLVKAALPWFMWLAIFAVGFLLFLALLGLLDGWVPLVTAAILLPRIAAQYLGWRYGLYVIFHDRRIDFRVPGEKGKLTLPYERVVSYRDLPGNQVEIAYLLALQRREFKDNLRSVIFQPQNPAGVLEEIRMRLEIFSQIGWAPAAAAGGERGNYQT